MSVTTKPKRFVSNGIEFDTEADAKRHDELVTARDALSEAQRTYQRQLAETQRTADGHVFEFRGLHDYYYIRDMFSFPHLDRVSFFGWNWSVREDEKLGVVIRDDDKSHWYRIDELYYDERAANKSLAVAQAKRIADLIRRANELRKQVGMTPLSGAGGAG